MMLQQNYISPYQLLAACFSQGFSNQPSCCTILKLTEGHCECLHSQWLGIVWVTSFLLQYLMLPQQKLYFTIVITSCLFSQGFSQQTS